MHKKLKGDKTFWAKWVLVCLCMRNWVYGLSHPSVSRGKKKASLLFRYEKNQNLWGIYYCWKESRGHYVRRGYLLLIIKKIGLNSTKICLWGSIRKLNELLCYNGNEGGWVLNNLQNWNEAPLAKPCSRRALTILWLTCC